MTDGPRILICDDEPGIRKTLSQILDDEGYTGEAVGSGRRLLDALRRRGPATEAIFLDVWLPDMDGLTVLDRACGPLASRCRSDHDLGARHGGHGRSGRQAGRG